MAQKLHERVQMLPRIISVAVPRDQHSPRFGHWALWQTVWRRFSSTSFRVATYPGPPGRRARSQAGFRAVVFGSSMDENAH